MDTPSLQPRVQRIETGGGRVVVHLHGSKAVFSELSSTYPLKLLSPRIEQDRVAVAYILTYGGGLVGGDRVDLVVIVGAGVTLVLLSQVCLLRGLTLFVFTLRSAGIY